MHRAFRSSALLPLFLSIIFAILTIHPAEARARRARPRILRVEATAFSVASKPTSAGTVAHEGIVAADPAFLPLGTRIRVMGSGAYDGIYTVTDTGAKVAGAHIDLYMPTAAEAKQFGKKFIRIQIVETGAGKQDAREKEAAAAIIPAK